MKLTKNKIEELATEIMDFLEANNLENDVCLYFNNKRVEMGHDWINGNVVITKVTRDNMCPLDYFEYANPKHILSMSFEGALCHELNGYYGSYDVEEKLQAIFEKYGLYYEMGHHWNLSAYPLKSDYTNIEYTSYETETDRE